MISENDKEKKTQQKKSKEVSRRGFLKASLGVGVGATGAALFGSELPGSNIIANAATVEHDTMPVEISADYKRYSSASLLPVFTVTPGVKEYFGVRAGVVPPPEGWGWDPVNTALFHAAWSIEGDINHYKPNTGYRSTEGLCTWDGKVNPDTHKFESPEAASDAVKRAAMFFGASKVGIAPYDERWLYSEIMDDPATNNLIPNDLPFTPTHAIVILLEMDYDGSEAAPLPPATIATADIYSNLGIINHKMATFIRQLGYKCLPCTNDTALSIPMAIQAGLGEMSRAGILLTSEFGARVRICKLFVDMPLAADKPISFGGTEFCKTCMKCADACPTQAISHDKEPSYKVFAATNPGVKKWAMDGTKCITQMGTTGGSCSICIKVCPYNKQQEWHHEFVKLGTKTPARPVLRFFDDLFGYGKITPEDAVKKFWKK
jgi:reductive dehalogenase